MSSIPEDLYLEILLRVPARSTFVCKCVCKTWLSLVSDPTFAKMHLDFTPRRNISSKLVVSNINNLLHSINIDSLEPSLWETNEFTRLRYPYESLGYAVQIIGSCNGLVCLMLYATLDSTVAEDSLFFCLWNPATREYKKINTPRDEIVACNIEMHTLGYDHKNHDYKLVIGDYYNGSTSVHIYTLESDSWESAITVPFIFFPYQKSGVLVNGSTHFYASREGLGKLIVSMDISKERFKEIELSKELKENGHWFLTEAVLEGRLCVLSVFGANRVAEDHYRVELWVMQDYGVGESWSKLYTITHEIITRKLTYELFSLNLVSSSKNGEILLSMNNGWLILYDPRDGSAIERYMAICSEVSYIESLVSANSGAYVTEDQIEETSN